MKVSVVCEQENKSRCFTFQHVSKNILVQGEQNILGDRLKRDATTFYALYVKMTSHGATSKTADQYAYVDINRY